jgi:16S rRNA (cytosine967-C5)-methyltransferase
MTIKLFPALVQAVHFALRRIFSEGAYADKVVPELLKQHPRWGARDRQFVAETTYDIVRWWRKYWHILGEDANLNAPALQDIIALSLLQRGYSILNPDLLDIAEISVLQKKLYAPITNTAITESIPQWLYDRLLLEYNDVKLVARILGALNELPLVYLRVNTLRTTVEKTIKQLQKDEIVTERVADTTAALLLSTRKSLLKTDVYLNGHVEFQDIGSQMIGEFCNVRKGMTVVDVCAGAGGKTIQLAALMQNKGTIYAADKNTHRMAQLYKRAERAGVNILKIKTLEDLDEMPNKADLVLIDAPCSGLGVLRRSPDTKWKLKETVVNELVETQIEILRRHQSLPKVGGCIVYATCSVLFSESEYQVRDFLAEQPNFILEAEQRMQPYDGFDGFYMARLRRMR